jgi:hypothetical protein
VLKVLRKASDLQVWELLSCCPQLRKKGSVELEGRKAGPATDEGDDSDGGCEEMADLVAEVVGVVVVAAAVVVAVVVVVVVVVVVGRVSAVG